MALKKKAKKSRQGDGKFTKWPTHKKARNKTGKPSRGQGRAR